MKKPFRCRVECVDGFGNKSYFDIKDHTVRYYSSAIVPLAISNIAPDNAALDKYARLAKTWKILVTP